MDVPNNFGMTPLHLACHQGRPRLVELLLDQGGVCDLDKYTRGHYSAEVLKLLEHRHKMNNASPEGANDAGSASSRTALHSKCCLRPETNGVAARKASPRRDHAVIFYFDFSQKYIIKDDLVFVRKKSLKRTTKKSPSCPCPNYAATIETVLAGHTGLPHPLQQLHRARKRLPQGKSLRACLTDPQHTQTHQPTPIDSFLLLPFHTLAGTYLGTFPASYRAATHTTVL